MQDNKETQMYRTVFWTYYVFLMNFLLMFFIHFFLFSYHFTLMLFVGVLWIFWILILCLLDMLWSVISLSYFFLLSSCLCSEICQTSLYQNKFVSFQKIIPLRIWFDCIECIWGKPMLKFEISKLVKMNLSNGLILLYKIDSSNVNQN